ncbi:hypothetical protein CYMTET_45264 [Cymbomonas tetramitiformis]|uniref:C2 Aida-type domain-containing protein n=1 Tax=Cymbomonas tetramitiformis TaxID=36881 RepID=A0AAE0EYG9_9CHLO|nr:hypothetical protein CYMTET_45264 [Cymbomonas tetramitiformis]
MERADTQRMWDKEFKVALESDSWGQIEEAKESYERLATKIKELHDENTFRFSAQEKALLLKLSAALNLRSREMRDDVELGVGTRGMQLLRKLFEVVLVKNDPCPEFPFDLPSSALQAVEFSNQSSAGSRADVLAGGLTEIEGGSLLPPPALRDKGDEALSIHIEKIGFKDATVFIDPCVTVSVVDKESELIESQQDTPPSNRNKPNYVLFGNTVHIQTPINRLEKGAAILFEFKHFKPKKKKVSTKAWAFMELEEFTNAHGNNLSLEIYKKPTDVKRKKLNLLSVKPLYLHVELTSRIH